MAGQIFAPDGTLIAKFKGNQTNRPTVPNGAGVMVAAADRYNYGNLPEVLLANSLFIEDPARPDEPSWPRTKPPAVSFDPGHAHSWWTG